MNVRISTAPKTHYEMSWAPRALYEKLRAVLGSRNTLLSEVRSLQAQTDVRLMVTSRPVISIEQAFENDLPLEVRAQKEDVERYLEGRMSQQPSGVFQDLDLRQLIKMSITKAIDGM